MEHAKKSFAYPTLPLTEGKRALLMSINELEHHKDDPLRRQELEKQVRDRFEEFKNIENKSPATGWLITNWESVAKVSSEILFVRSSLTFRRWTQPVIPPRLPSAIPILRTITFVLAIIRQRKFTRSMPSSWTKRTAALHVSL